MSPSDDCGTTGAIQIAVHLDGRVHRHYVGRHTEK